ncbi:cyclin [Pseudozyma hubeiensis SY62]|uniref:Cyclin n=1 Tax=Pseudozyma hubeiensis (strain SY62) TaxID=1305764 RepID=R9NY27_PSEHS|nr:cyclin [Pseudozyma hubeiensis SY62]GAC93482.1 cyclin [Pseudozyma hubeiensis SY62]
MLSSSPDHLTAASPPGPPSSQSSSVGSCYTSESSRASFQARPTLSDPSSSSTSPASAYDRPSELTHTPALVKRSAETTPVSPRSSTHHTSIDRHPNQFGARSTNHTASLSRASPRADHSRIRTMQPPASGPREFGHLDAYHRSGSSRNVINESSPHAAREAQHFGSPDNHSGPAPKARRTSPGGSRAPPHQGSPVPYSHNANSHPLTTTSRSPTASTQASSSGTTTQANGFRTETSWSDTLAGGRPPDQNQGAQPSWPHSEHPQSHVTQPLMLSPRSHGIGAGPEQQDPHPPTSTRSASPQLWSHSLADRSEGASRSKQPSLPKMDLATFAPQELLKILATLLHEIATANDDFQPDGGKDESSRSRRSARSRDRSTPATPADSNDTTDASAMRGHSAPPGSHLSFNDSRRPSVTTAALGALATPSSTLCFHARNVPSISIESYLLRILKYCPTTNEVFLSLLVYFDRMSRMGTGAKPGANGEGEVAGEAAGLPRAVERATGQQELGLDASARQSDGTSSKEVQPYTHPGIRGFAIDSYNVHRLVIAGVTVASKFFSDVFYTNSRYAKVGGLPPHELNQLELQFLLLNDFRLTIPLEEMQRYADQLLMYASGRPEMAKLTKAVSSNALSDSSSSKPNASSDVRSASSADAGQAVATSGTSSQGASASAGRHEADSEGDVQMADAQP